MKHYISCNHQSIIRLDSSKKIKKILRLDFFFNYNFIGIIDYMDVRIFFFYYILLGIDT